MDDELRLMNHSTAANDCVNPNGNRLSTTGSFDCDAGMDYNSGVNEVRPIICKHLDALGNSVVIIAKPVILINEITSSVSESRYRWYSLSIPNLREKEHIEDEFGYKDRDKSLTGGRSMKKDVNLQQVSDDGKG
ncbi:hypothetical protein DFH28DRAFT_926328 [Melampsora americana]|nr:hypothetical protein DFH28DRAFT_926328 [Melampsora americana]